MLSVSLKFAYFRLGNGVISFSTPSTSQIFLNHNPGYSLAQPFLPKQPWKTANSGRGFDVEGSWHISIHKLPYFSYTFSCITMFGSINAFWVSCWNQGSKSYDFASKTKKSHDIPWSVSNLATASAISVFDWKSARATSREASLLNRMIPTRTLSSFIVNFRVSIVKKFFTWLNSSLWAKDASTMKPKSNCCRLVGDDCEWCPPIVTIQKM